MNSLVNSNVDNSELRLLANAAQGDAQARRELFETYRSAAFRVAARITGREADALDVVQDSFIKAFERLDAFEGGSSFKTWFLRIVTNRALDLLRSRKVRLAAPLDTSSETGPPEPGTDQAESDPSRGLEQEELGQQLKQAIDALPPDQKAVFAMYATGEVTYGDIAAALAIPVGTVMSRLYHARKRLQDALADLAPP